MDIADRRDRPAGTISSETRLVPDLLNGGCSDGGHIGATNIQHARLGPWIISNDI